MQGTDVLAEDEVERPTVVVDVEVVGWREEDVELAPGMTGGQISKQLQVQQLNQQMMRASGGRRGINAKQIKQIFENTRLGMFPSSMHMGKDYKNMEKI